MAFINLGQVIYPIGAIYASTNSTSPANLFGGTWSQITGDACLMAGSGFGNVGSKKISVSQMPSHRHGIGWYHTEGTSMVNFPVDCTHLGEQKGYTGIQTYDTGGGKIICLTLTVATCGGEPRKSSDALCVI